MIDNPRRFGRECPVDRLLFRLYYPNCVLQEDKRTSTIWHLTVVDTASQMRLYGCQPNNKPLAGEEENIHGSY